MNPSQSSLLHDVEISGSVTFKGSLSMDCSLKNGEVKGEHLVVGPQAHIEGNIQSASLTLNGSVTGDVTVSEKCNLTSGAKLIGRLTTNRLVMDEGATFIGQAEITPDGKKHLPPPK